MFCENCGSRLEENAQFCMFCGKPVSKIMTQEMKLQKSTSEQAEKSQPKVLQKLSQRLIASTVLWVVAGVLNIITLKYNFAYWSMLSKVSAIVELIIVFAVAFVRFSERTEVYTNIHKIDEDYGEICSSAGFIVGAWNCFDLLLTWKEYGYLHPLTTICLILYVTDILLINVYVKIHGTQIWELAQIEQRQMEEQKAEREKERE